VIETVNSCFVCVYVQLDLQENQYLQNILRIKSKEVHDFLELLFDNPENQRNERWAYYQTLFYFLANISHATNNEVLRSCVKTN
jgi:hypothetical protein